MEASYVSYKFFDFQYALPIFYTPSLMTESLKNYSY